MHKIELAWAALIVVVIALFDVTVAPFMAIARIKPDFVLITVLFFSLYGGFTLGWKVGFLAGILKDVFTSSLFGTNILFMWLAGSLFGYHYAKFYRERVFTQVLITFLTGLGYAVFYYVFLRFVRGAQGLPFAGIEIWRFAAGTALPFAFYTAVIAPCMFFLYRTMFCIRH